MGKGAPSLDAEGLQERKKVGYMWCWFQPEVDRQVWNLTDVRLLLSPCKPNWPLCISLVSQVGVVNSKSA